MIQIPLNVTQRRTLRSVLNWMAGDAEYKSVPHPEVIDDVPVSAEKATWASVSLCCDIWGQYQQHPFDAINLADVIDKVLLTAPDDPPKQKPKPRQMTLIGDDDA